MTMLALLPQGNMRGELTRYKFITWSTHGHSRASGFATDAAAMQNKARLDTAMRVQSGNDVPMNSSGRSMTRTIPAAMARRQEQR